jgi:hypothetical protein
MVTELQTRRQRAFIYSISTVKKAHAKGMPLIKMSFTPGSPGASKVTNPQANHALFSTRRITSTC